ncbi:MAG: terpene cyclase/mutase family protein [Kiritimatiellae bacterium]|nr:terpene cyclase/mutase family protein [Kiritimatiellia bacterium]
MNTENNISSNIDQNHDRAYQEMMKLFENENFFTRMKRMVNGFGQPKDSGEYKFAKLQLQRLSCPFFAIILPLIAVLFLLSIETKHEVKTTIKAVQLMKDIDVEIEEIPETPKEKVEFELPDTDFDGPVSDISTPNLSDVSTPNVYSPKPSKMDTVANIASPITMVGVLPSRNPGNRGSALNRFGGSAAGEASVMRALRWLKSKQNENGSWGDKNQTAMTGLAILTYLAHGETPSLECEEFGETVQKGIKWLTSNVKENGMFNQLDGNYYAQLIGAYALSEAYAMTRVPAVKIAAEKTIRRIIEGQQASGGFDYKLNPNSNRNDLSYSGWATQAIKAAHLAELDIKKTLADGTEIDLLHQAYEKCIRGIRENAIAGSAENGFSYTPSTRSHVGLTGVGALCLQLLGDSKATEVKNALKYLDDCTFSFDDWGNQPYNKGDNPSPIYYWYYITQAKFHAGGERWKQWNAVFSKELIAKQNVINGAIADAKGNMRDIGYWQSPSENESFRGGGEALWKDIMDTCLCTLQLEVYYRYLPSFQTPAITDSKVVEVDDDEVTITF